LDFSYNSFNKLENCDDDKDEIRGRIREIFEAIDSTDMHPKTEVVNRAEIEKTHARDLKEALEHVPGLLLKEIHGKSGYEVWLQGLDSDRVLVIIDGEPITPSTGSTVDLTQISTADVERIEIVKGATSALYGSSAMGGVINVITRRPDRPKSYSLTIDGGSYGDHYLEDSSVISAHNLVGKFALKQREWDIGLSILTL